MRFRVIACSCLLIAVSAGGVKTLAASPDCARWIRDYQQGLAKRGAAAKKHVVHAARHLGVPKPKLVHASVPVHRLHPARLSPQEMLKRFRVLCGDDLPDEPIAASFVPTSLDALLIPPIAFADNQPLTELGTPVAFTPVPTGDTGTPATPPVTSNPGVLPPIVVGGIPGVPGIPVVTNPTPPVVPPVEVSPVPEPSSLLLLLTGALGAIPLVKRRFQ